MKQNNITMFFLALTLITLFSAPSQGSNFSDNELRKRTLSHSNSPSEKDVREEGKIDLSSKTIENNIPKNNNIETIVRLRSAEQSDETETVEACGGKGCTDYTGMELIFETRNKETKKFYWVASVSFRPKKRPLDKYDFMHESKISISYIIDPNYEMDDLSKKTNSAILDQANKKVDPKRYKKWILSSYFEWVLNEENTLAEIGVLENIINEFKDKKTDKFPPYYLMGYAHAGGCLNCVTFSMLLLEKVGILFSESALIKSYIAAWQQPTRCYNTVGALAVTGCCLVGIGSCVAGALDLYTKLSTSSLVLPTLNDCFNLSLVVTGEMCCFAGCGFCYECCNSSCNNCLSRLTPSPSYIFGQARPEKFIAEIYRLSDKLGVKIVGHKNENNKLGFNQDFKDAIKKMLNIDVSEELKNNDDKCENYIINTIEKLNIDYKISFNILS